MTIAFISHPDCALHDMGPEHPEAPARLGAIHDALIVRGIDGVLRHYDAPLASREQLVRVHEPAYLDRLAAELPTEGLHWIDAETAMNRHTLRAAERAAGAVVLAVDLVLHREASAAFCAVRPPGHHAGRGHALGFCFLNNIAVGVAHALEVHGLERVAICDFDGHHGNGIEEVFREDPRCLYCSTFEHPLFPYSGAESSSVHVINVPLKAGTDGHAFRRAVAEEWIERMVAFDPQLVVVAAGFDGHLEDEMTHLRLTEDDYAWVTREIKLVADTCADGRIVSVLEGGYALAPLGRCVATHIDALLGHQHLRAS
jgi:acetoin utilization deacetylase AcuC-like enzyme